MNALMQPAARPWQAVIGLEIHAQLSTASKLFSGASTAYGAEPNTQTSLVDCALPGTLPVPNREAVRKAMAALGVSDNQMEAVSLGKEKPKATGHDEAAWAENRRADIVYQ